MIAARLSEAREGIDHLRTELAQWPALVDALGDPGQHRTQVTSVSDTLAKVLARIEATLTSEPATPGAAYEMARIVDRQVAFCRRLWRWFADRWDQRADPALVAALHGADELVWSVWKTTFDAARVPLLPAPLPFVDDQYVASATLRMAPPLTVKAPSSDLLLTQCVEVLPVPVIGLPATVLRRPWWLVVVLHETGHHIQHDLVAGLVDRVGDVVAQAATAAGADGTEAEAWRDWSREIFADVFGAAFAGAAACWMVAELERREPAGLVTGPTPLYPPPVVREAIVRQVVGDLGVTPPPAQLSLDPAALSQSVRGQLQRVPAVVSALLDVPLAATSLRALGAGLPDRERSAAFWCKAFQPNEPAPKPRARLDASPPCVAGAVRAWAQLVAADEGADPMPLRTRLLDVLPHCRVGGTRARGPAVNVGEATIESLVSALPGADFP